MRRVGGSAAVLFALLAASGCGDVKLDVKVPGYDEAMQALADTLPPPRMTRAEALAEHRDCIRRLSRRDTVAHPELRGMSGDPERACAHFLQRAYPEPRHARRRDPDSLHVAPAPVMTREELDRRLLEGLRDP